MIAIMRPNGHLIWFDAVISFQEAYSSSTTKHQVESGSVISDHVIHDNPKFSMEGVLTAVEFGGVLDYFSIAPQIPGGLGVTHMVNLDFASSFISIKTPRSNKMVSMLPDSIRQFIGEDSPPAVTMGAGGFSTDIQEVKTLLINLNTGFPKYDETRKRAYYEKELVTLVEFDSKFQVVQELRNCVCTGISFARTPDKGDALYPQMSFEQIRFATLEATVLPANVTAQLKNKAADKANKGKVQTPSSTGSASDAKMGPYVIRSSAAEAQKITGGYAEGSFK